MTLQCNPAAAKWKCLPILPNPSFTMLGKMSGDNTHTEQNPPVKLGQENEFFSRCHPIISCILTRLNNSSCIGTRRRNTPSSWHLKSQPEYLISHSLPTCKFDVELVLGLENLDVEGAIRSKVFHCPGSEDGLMILRKLETVLDSV